MRTAIFLILALALVSGTLGILGCTAEEVKEEAEDYRRAKDSAKRSMELNPNRKSTPVGDPWPSVKEGPQPASAPPDKGK